MRRILVVDDEYPIRTLLQAALVDAGYEVFLAGNGQEALEQFRLHDPSVVITDLRMPEMGGAELLEKLDLGNQMSKAAIVLTGKAGDAAVQKCFDAGVQDFLRKPVNLFELEGIVKRTFQILETTAALQQEIKKKEKAIRLSDSLNHLLKLTVDALGGGVMTLDDHFRVRLASASACKMLECDEQEVEGKPAAAVLGAAIAGPSGLIVEAARSARNFYGEDTELLCPSGAVVPVSMDIIELATEGLSGWLLVLRDKREAERQLRESIDSYRFGRILGCDPLMLRLFENIEKLAGSDANVLVWGESGTGKELVARELHDRSKRAQNPFHAVNCAAISGELLESEFFGHEKGAFTGASQMKKGRFELADGGTLFLDEVGEIPMRLQGKLLRALQEQQFERVGGLAPIKVDVRIIAATNRDLKVMVEQKCFRSDLFYRLHVAPIHLPPLRDRLLDIPLLASHFIKKFNDANQRNVQAPGPEIIQFLLNYSWPGNIRELINVLEYAFVLSTGNQLSIEDFPDLHSKAKSAEEQPENEKEQTLWALRQANFNNGRAAALLGVNRTTLYRRKKKYGILG